MLFLLSVNLSYSEATSKRENEDDNLITINQLRENFKSPEREYSVNCWWWWLNSNVTKEAITKDLEAMKAKNFQGATIYDAGGQNQRGNKNVPVGPLFGSPEWIDLFVFALDEARRLDLEIGFTIQSGWNLGGPNITPEYAAKHITFTENIVEGGELVNQQLEQPKARKNFYKDVAVVAFPANPTNETKDVIEALDFKLGYHELGGSATDCRFLLENQPTKLTKKQSKVLYKIDPKEILLLNDNMDKKGNLKWNAPSGKWNVMRIGYTYTGAVVSTASDGWEGAVLDYMSPRAFDYYCNTVIEPILKAAEDHVGTTLKYLETDSWECGGMNWTENFADYFKSYCGYDIIKYLPVYAGHIITDVNETNSFLADLRKTIAHTVAVNHYARFQEYAHKYNMGIMPESAGPHAGPFDGIKNYGFSDIVMSEFWAPSPHSPRPVDRFFVKQASSAAHIYGKKLVGAESFTTIGPHWNDEIWHDQKPAFDHEICSGFNRLYFTTFTCSPKEQGLPGQEYFAGTHVNPQVTWWNQIDGFVRYMHRTQMMVQEGKFVADVLYYYGDHVPNVFPYKQSDPAGAMFGYDYDVTDETIFLQLKVEDGKVVTPTGMKYNVLVLPDHKILSYPVLQKLEALVKEGAKVIGYKPLKTVSLVGGTKAQKQFKLLADKIWGNFDTEKGSHKYGSGSVNWGVTAKEYLQSCNIPVDFQIEGNTSKTDFDYIHYTVGDAEVYFVSNQTESLQKINTIFRVTGKQPEIWDALTGDIRKAEAFTQKDGRTSVPLTLEPYGTTFVVFHDKISTSKQGKAQHNYLDYETVNTLSGSWTVNFDPKWGGPASVEFPELIDWTTHTDKGIKYYSGTAIYNKTFNVDFQPNGTDRYFIELGDVQDVGMASVRINGIDKGVVWTKPFRIEVSKELKSGENRIEISVTNSWYNRVAGDEISVFPHKLTKTNIVLSNDFRGQARTVIPLEPSGLLGPVTLKKGVK